MTHSVFCIAPSISEANAIVSHLKAARFDDRDISVLMPDQSAARGVGLEAATKAPEGAVIGASTGGLVGGALGLLAGIGLLAIPGLGPFVAAGPIMASLAGLGAGAAVGGLTGSLVGLGVPEVEAKRYEGKLKQGSILIAVQSEDDARLTEARDIFAAAGASDINSGPVAAGNAAAPDRRARAAEGLQPTRRP